MVTYFVPVAPIAALVPCSLLTVEQSGDHLDSPHYSSDAALKKLVRYTKHLSVFISFTPAFPSPPPRVPFHVLKDPSRVEIHLAEVV